jgi:putative nucleotidyltransferase with HDIG domain
MSEPGKTPKILAIGLTPLCQELLKKSLPECGYYFHEYSDELLMDAYAEPISLLVCGDPPPGLKGSEVAQSLRMIYSETPIHFATESREGFHRQDFTKNGFTDAFLLPNDQAIWNKSLRQELARMAPDTVEAFRTIQLLDITPGVVLGFDLYLNLPANNRRLKYVGSAESLGEARAAKLKKHQFQSAMVPEKQIKQFYQFTASCLKSAGGTLSETERAEKRQKAVRDVLSGVFGSDVSGDSLEGGRQLMTDCQEIVKAFIADPASGKTAWYDKLLSISDSDQTPYSHASDVATLAALLSIGLGVGDPKDLALAGLLHDIGLTSVPAEIILKKPEDRTGVEQNIYEKHPLSSVVLIKERKMIVSEKVCQIIEQHHERFDGNGYPNHMPGPKVCKEAQLLAVADEVAYLTQIRPGSPRVSPVQAIMLYCERELKNPMVSKVDPSLLRKLKSMFAQQTAEKAAV